MNKEYVYKDGKALVIDESNNQKVIDYYDNLDEVLLVEDLIETMEIEIKNFESEVSSFKKQSKFSKLLTWFPFVSSILTPVISMILAKLFYIEEVIGFSPIRYGLSIGLVLTPFVAFIGGAISFKLHADDKRNLQIENAKMIQLEYLKNELSVQQEYLEKLKTDQTNTRKIGDFSMSTIDHTETLNNLKAFLSFYYHLGFNEDKYFNYYQEGTLDEHLKDVFTEVGIQAANDYFEERGPSLVKRPR